MSALRVEVPFTWGYHDQKEWKINDIYAKRIKRIGKYRYYYSIYSVETFNSNTFDVITFTLRIKKRYERMYIGIINNVQHKNTLFCQKEIPNNNEMKIKQNMYYCINAKNGEKSSHVTNYKWEKCMNDGINSGDRLTFSINFPQQTIFCVKNHLRFIPFENIEDIKNTNWRLVVTAWYPDDCVELISCEHLVTPGKVRRLMDQESKMEDLLSDKESRIEYCKKEKELNLQVIREKK